MIVFFIILHVVAFYFQRVQVWYITKTSLLLFENRGRVKITPFIPRHKFKQRGEVLYIENYKTLMKRTEKNTNKWKDSPCLQLLKGLYSPKEIDRFSTIPIAIPKAFFKEIE